MFIALKNARLNDKFQDPLYLFLELVRAGVMHGHLWSGRAFSGGPSFGTGEPFFHSSLNFLVRLSAFLFRAGVVLALGTASYIFTVPFSGSDAMHCVYRCIMLMLRRRG